jgi:hypothetical protein
MWFGRFRKDYSLCMQHEFVREMSNALNHFKKLINNSGAKYKEKS